MSTVAYHPICFVIFFSFNFFLFSTTILSGPYFWNRYSQRLQIECAAWSCGPIEHCCLPSNSLFSFFFLLIFSFFPPRFCLGDISGTVTCRDSKLSVLLGPAVQLSTVAYHPIRFFLFFFLLIFSFFPPRFCLGHISGTVTRRDSKLSVLLGPVVQLSTFAYHPIRFVIFFFLLIFFFFSTTILSGPYLWNPYSQRLQIECVVWSCGLIEHYCLPSNLLCYFFSFNFFLFSPHDFVWAISLEPLLAETPNWVCCLLLWSSCGLLLTIQFALLFFFLLIFAFFSTTILSGPYLWNPYSQRLQIECAACSCGLVVDCCLPSNLLCYFFFF